jgi:hypothetical protein
MNFDFTSINTTTIPFVSIQNSQLSKATFFPYFSKGEFYMLRAPDTVYLLSKQKTERFEHLFVEPWHYHFYLFL